MDAAFTWLNVPVGLPYILAFAAGLVVLVLFSLDKFDLPYPGNRHLARFLPSDMVGAADYTRAFLIYVMLLGLLYAVACLMVVFSPRIAALVGLAAAAGRPVAAVEGPLAVALIMVGLLPALPQFSEVEARLRRLAHRAIGVPHSLSDMERHIAGLQLNGDQFSPADRQMRAGLLRLFLARQLALAPPAARAALEAWLAAGDAEAPLPAPEGLPRGDARFLAALAEQVANARRVAGKWFRAKHLMARLNGASAGQPVLDNEVARRFQSLRTDLDAGHATLAATVTRIRTDVENLLELLQDLQQTQVAAGPADLGRVQEYLDRLLDRRLQDLVDIEPAVDDVLAKLHLLLAAAELLRGRRSPGILRALGLVQQPAPRGTADDGLLAMALLAATVAAFNYAWLSTPGLGTSWLSGQGTSHLTAALRLTVATLIVHGAGLLIAMPWRTERISRGTWRTPFEGAAMVPMRQYLLLSLAVFVPAALGVLAQSFVLYASVVVDSLDLSTSEDRQLVAGMALSAAGACVTALFTVWALDRAARGAGSAGQAAAWSLAQGAATGLIVAATGEVAGHIEPREVASAFVAGCLLGAVVHWMSSPRRSPAPDGPPVAAHG